MGRQQRVPSGCAMTVFVAWISVTSTLHVRADDFFQGQIQPPSSPSAAPASFWPQMVVTTELDEQPAVEAGCQSANELLQRIRPLKDSTLSVVPSGKLPADCYAMVFQQALPVPPPIPTDVYCFHWHASGVTHHPLYFEDVPLERYGHTNSPIVQPLCSGAKFVAGVISLPYRMGVDPPYKVHTPLGFERPGNYARSVREHLPWSWHGATLQAGAVTGTMFLFP